MEILQHLMRLQVYNYVLITVVAAGQSYNSVIGTRDLEFQAQTWREGADSCWLETWILIHQQ